MKQPSRFLFSWRTAVALGLILCLGSFVALLSQSKKEPPVTFPKAVLLIRHAEEPPKAEASIHLSDSGKRRAEALHGLFETSPGRPEPFPKPDFLFAPKPGGKSRRSLETLEPLAKQRGLTVAADLDKEDAEKLAHKVLHDPKYAGKTILVAWNHSMLPALARAFKAGNVPMEWKESHYDRIWVIRYGTGGAAEFQDLPQSLMPGDGAK
jgi:hypothetical protein